jgi:hypothetical protein
VSDSPEVTAAKRLLDTAKDRGFTFQRTAPGADGPLVGVRDTLHWRDVIHLSGFWAPESCSAQRLRRSSLVIPGGLPVTKHVSGDALTVLHTVLSDWTT